MLVRLPRNASYDARLLRLARDRISQRKDWAQGACISGGAVCAFQAVKDLCQDVDAPSLRVERLLEGRLLRRVAREMPWRLRLLGFFWPSAAVALFNDKCTHQEMLDVFDQSIIRAERHRGFGRTLHGFAAR